jgi:23S rRNA pseudouridine1911/1915/1917 synthase
MKYIGHPLLGDPVYGKGAKNPFHFVGQALHARTIGFLHPVSGEYLEFSAFPPADMENVLALLRKGY